MKPDTRFAYPEEGVYHEADLLTTIPGMQFEECYARSMQVELDGVMVRVLGLDNLIKSKEISAKLSNDKKASDRDRADIEDLLAVCAVREASCQ